MENNKYELDVKRIKDRAKSLKLLLDFYEQEDIVSVYIYDLIAYLVLNYSKEKSTNIKYDKFIMELIFNSISEKYIEMKLSSLTGIVEQINKYSLLERTIQILLDMYIQNEKDIDKEYQTNMEPKKSIVEKFVYKVTYDPVKTSYAESVHSKMVEEILTMLSLEKSIKKNPSQYQNLQEIANQTIKQVFAKKVEEKKDTEKVGRKSKV